MSTDTGLAFGDIIGWTRIAAWLVDHGLLAPGADHPLLPLPGADGAGLDDARIAVIVVAVLVWLLLRSDIQGRRRRIPPHQY